MKTLKLIILPAIKQQFSLLLFAGFCITLLLVRAKVTQSVFYFFLIWNLFLAYMPFAVSSYLSKQIVLIQKKRYLFIAFTIWLLMFPNAPYIITDFIHLKQKSAIPIWFDVLLLVSFASCGMWLGLKSLNGMFTIFRLRFSKISAWIMVICSSFLSGFNVYLGRFLRYNSWDILHKPLQLITDVFTAFTNSLAIGMTFGFGMLLITGFTIFRNNSK